jgi:hypothetical protein
MFHGDFVRAEKKCEEAIARYHGHFYPPQMLAIIKLFARDFPAAETEYRKLLQTDRKGGTTFYCCVSNLSALGFLRMQAGDTKEGERLLAENTENQTKALSKAPKNREFLYDLAASEAALGKTGECFHVLDRTLAAGWIDYRTLSMDPRFDSVRSDPRFTTILKDLAKKVAALREEKQPAGELAQNAERETKK